MTYNTPLKFQFRLFILTVCMYTLNTLKTNCFFNVPKLKENHRLLEFDKVYLHTNA